MMIHTSGEEQGTMSDNNGLRSFLPGATGTVTVASSGLLSFPSLAALGFSDTI
jgi:hypothetical protein